MGLERDSEFLDEGNMGGGAQGDGAQGSGGYGSTGGRGPLAQLALEALLDAEFYERLKEDPQRAAESMGIQLSDSDAAYLGSEVHWSVVDAHMAEMRDALHLGIMRAGPLW